MRDIDAKSVCLFIRIDVSVRVLEKESFLHFSPFFGLARPRLLFDPVRCSPDVRPKLRIVTDSFWKDTLGITLESLFAVGHVFAVWAL